MNKINYNILIGCLIISIGIVVHGYLSTDTKDEIGVLMDISQVSNYMGMKEDKVLKIIEIEQNMLHEYHTFSGTMFPFFIVDNKYYFYKEAVNKWIDYVMLEKYEYDTNNGWLIQ